LLAARWSPLSPPSFRAVTRAPRERSKSNTAVWPSLADQRRGVKPWSSLQRKDQWSCQIKYDFSKLYHFVSNDPRCSTVWNINSCCFILLYSINDLQYTSCLASYGMKTHRNYSQQENCFYAKLTCRWERSDSFANSLPQFVFCSNKTDSLFTFYNCWHFIVLTPGLGRSTYFPARSSQIEGSRHVKLKRYLPSFERSEPTPICTNVRTQLTNRTEAVHSTHD